MPVSFGDDLADEGVDAGAVDLGGKEGEGGTAAKDVKGAEAGTVSVDGKEGVCCSFAMAETSSEKFRSSASFTFCPFSSPPGSIPNIIFTLRSRVLFVCAKFITSIGSAYAKIFINVVSFSSCGTNLHSSVKGAPVVILSGNSDGEASVVNSASDALLAPVTAFDSVTALRVFFVSVDTFPPSSTKLVILSSALVPLDMHSILSDNGGEYFISGI